MALKPNARLCPIREQIIEDPVSGLTLQFEFVTNDPVSPVRVKILGALTQGNRELMFDANGEFNGAGTALGGTCRASWLKVIAD